MVFRVADRVLRAETDECRSPLAAWGNGFFQAIEPAESVVPAQRTFSRSRPTAVKARLSPACPPPWGSRGMIELQHCKNVMLVPVAWVSVGEKRQAPRLPAPRQR